MARIRSLIAAGVLLAIGFASPARAQVTINLSCSSLGIELELCQTGADQWSKQTGNQVRLISAPPDGNERLAFYQTLLAAGSSDIDILQIDVVWPGMLAPHLIDLTPYIPKEELADHIEALTANDTVSGKLVAAPFFVDAGLLYYRKDLLDKYVKPVPKTWAELTQTAKAITEAERNAGNKDMQGYVWQGRAYEGLTCNGIEWIASFGGGILELVLSLVIAFFLYREGGTAGSRLYAFSSRIGSERATRALDVAGGTIKGVVYGIVGTNLIQGVLSGIGFWVAGVPGAFLLGFLCFFLTMVPLAPTFIWLPSSLYLFYNGSTGMAIALAIWSFLIFNPLENVLRPYLISRGSDLPILLILLGMLGGLAAFGLLGIFVGPTILAVGYGLLIDWIEPASQPPD